MLHLIWAKNTAGDEGTNIHDNLLETLKRLYLLPKKDTTMSDASLYAAKNLIRYVSLYFALVVMYSLTC
jgi:hypothetical protein